MTEQIVQSLDLDDVFDYEVVDIRERIVRFSFSEPYKAQQFWLKNFRKFKERNLSTKVIGDWIFVFPGSKKPVFYSPGGIDGVLKNPGQAVDPAARVCPVLGFIRGWLRLFRIGRPKGSKR